MEEGPVEEELVRAVVHAEAQCPVLLHERGTEGEEGEHRVGQALLRGGTAWAVARGRDNTSHVGLSRSSSRWLSPHPVVTPCCVLSLQVLPDRDGKRCMFCVKTSSRTYEMSASDTRQRQEWTLGLCPHACSVSPPQNPYGPTNILLPSPAIQTAIRLQAEGKKSLHKDLKQKRREQREQREQRKAAKEEETQRLKQLQEEKERKLQELELLKEAQRQAEILLQEEEQRRRQQHEEMQRTLEIQLREAEQVGASSWQVLLRGCITRGMTAAFPIPWQCNLGGWRS